MKKYTDQFPENATNYLGMWEAHLKASDEHIAQLKELVRQEQKARRRTLWRLKQEKLRKTQKIRRRNRLIRDLLR